MCKKEGKERRSKGEAGVLQCASTDESWWRLHGFRREIRAEWQRNFEGERIREQRGVAAVCRGGDAGWLPFGGRGGERGSVRVGPREEKEGDGWRRDN
jgi:hypothetical protein